MLQSYFIGIIAIIGLMVLWVLVQANWKQVFRDEYADEDVLAGRSSCRNCGCTEACERKNKDIQFDHINS